MTARAPSLRDRPDRRYVQLRLRPMDSGQAVCVSFALEQIIERLPILLPNMRPTDLDLLAAVLVRTVRAIWRAHGNAMADHLGMLGVDTPAPPGSISTNDVDVPDLPF